MRRALLLLASLALHAPSAHAAEQTVAGWVELSGRASAAGLGFDEGGLGALRSGYGDGGSAALRAVLEHDWQIDDAFATHLVVSGWSDPYPAVGVTEAWLAWAPAPRSAWRWRARGGAFLAPFTLESTDRGWTTPYALSPAVLDAWLGEEVGVTGLELELRRLAAPTGGDHDLALRIGAFRGGDTAGTVLSWRGWAANDRVTPFNHTLALPVRAPFLPGGIYEGGGGRTDPFLEIDGRPGYYALATWRWRDRFELRGGRYDNRADPLRFAEGQIGWRTRFDTLGAVWHGARYELIAQWLQGDTLAGTKTSPYGVYDEYAAGYLLVSRRLAGERRVSLRYERFFVTDDDANPDDDNRQDGVGAALAWRRPVDATSELLIELRWIASERPERALLGEPVGRDERQLQVALRRRF